MVARWKPVHLGHAAALEALVASADEVLIGLGSSNRYDVRNPFTAEESAEMIRRVVGPDAAIRLIPVPDLGDGPRWRAMLGALFGPLDLFVTANDYVNELMQETYPVTHPARLIAPERRLRLDASAVRRAMAQGEGWRPMVPQAVAEFLEAKGLVQRFRREFGLETLAQDAPPRIE